MAITPERIREIKERLRQKQAEQRRRDFLAKIDFLYHFTDTRNLASIREHGGIYSLEQIERRGIEIPVFGGDDTSQDSDRSSGMDGYVHLCFRPHHPMEFRAKEAGRIEQARFLRINRAILDAPSVLFAPVMANTRGVRLYTLDDAVDADLIDFEVLYFRTDWRDSEVQERLQRAEKYEILIPDVVPLRFIENLPDG